MINDQIKFQTYLNRIINLFDIDKRIPSMVFKKSFIEFSFAEFDWAMSADFWLFIQKILTEKEKLLVAVLDPDPVNYFYREFGEYNFFELPHEATLDEYWNSLRTGPIGSPADAALYNSDIIVWVPTSMNWAVWGQRDLGVCVFASNNSITFEKELLSKNWLSTEEAIAKLLPLSSADGTVSESLSEKLRLTYNVIL